MNEYRNINNVPNPKKGDDDKEVVDAEKFKKALKVDASEETEKRGKRNRSKKAEEEEDVDDTTASIPVPAGLFKEYMSEKGEKPSILDAGDGSKVHFILDGQSPPPSKSEYLGQGEPGAQSNISIEIPDSFGAAPDEDEEVNTPIAESPPPAAIDTEDPNPSINSTTPTFDEEDNNITIPDNDQQSNTPAPSSTSKTDSKTTDKEPSKEKPVEKMKAAATPTKEIQLNPEEIKAVVPNKEEKREITTEPTSKEKTEAKVTESSGLSDQKHEGDREKESSSDQIAPPSAIPLASPTGIALPPLSPFSNMPNDVFQLFQKMVGFMQIAKDNGKSTTTVTLNMPNSIFNKCELVLEHFDTAPHAYNAQLFGNPEAVEKFANNMKSLNNAITESKLTFSINMLPPKLSKAYMGRVERKDSDAGGNSGGEKGDKGK